MAAAKVQRKLSATQAEALLQTLKSRFDRFPHRHSDLKWSSILKRLETAGDKLWSLNEMEQTGGEPDVIGQDGTSGEYLFVDCSPESPKGRRSLCYDQQARLSRKDHPPQNSAIEFASSMKIEILSEETYRQLQTLGEFDQKTSSWILTPQEIRSLDGALFCDRRYDHVFVYHNGAQSYYAARGFRGQLKV